MKLSEWAKKQGVSYRTAYRWFKNNQIPAKVTQLPTGTIIISDSITPSSSKKVVLYARVSSHDQKQDLQRQIQRLRNFASAQGYQIDQEITEIASGLNSNRKRLNKILEDPSINLIIVEHRDRLARFGVEMLQASLKASNREIIIINQEEFKDDILQDFIDLVTSMCARIYGKRSSKNRAQKALEATESL